MLKVKTIFNLGTSFHRQTIEIRVQSSENVLSRTSYVKAPRRKKACKLDPYSPVFFVFFVTILSTLKYSFKASQSYLEFKSGLFFCVWLFFRPHLSTAGPFAALQSMLYGNKIWKQRKENRIVTYISKFDLI